MSVRAKFKVTSVTATTYGQERVVMAPVYSEAGENREFWNATPSGSIDLGIDNKAAHGALKLGREYYVDFTEAPQP
jgi:hypothetical protein